MLAGMSPPPEALRRGADAGRAGRNRDAVRDLGVMLGQLEELLNQGPKWLFAPLGALVIVPVLVEVQAQMAP